MQSSCAGIRLHVKHTTCLFQMDSHRSADCSDGDDQICFPWIITHRSGLDMLVFKVTLCTDGILRATQLTWLPVLRVSAMSLYIFDYLDNDLDSELMSESLVICSGRQHYNVEFVRMPFRIQFVTRLWAETARKDHLKYLNHASTCIEGYFIILISTLPKTQ